MISIDNIFLRRTEGDPEKHLLALNILIFASRDRHSLETLWNTVVSNKFKFLKSDVPQIEIVCGMDNLNDVLFGANVSSILKHTVISYAIKTGGKKETILQKAGTPRGYHPSVMVNYLQTKIRACFNLGIGQREIKIFSEI